LAATATRAALFETKGVHVLPSRPLGHHHTIKEKKESKPNSVTQQTIFSFFSSFA
jgi:hypothetical protein